jgi:hypothetical protein
MSPEPAHLPPAEWRSHARAQCAVFAACRFLAAGGDNVGIGHWRTCCVNSEGCHLEYKCGRTHPTPSSWRGKQQPVACCRVLDAGPVCDGTHCLASTSVLKCFVRRVSSSAVAGGAAHSGSHSGSSSSNSSTACTTAQQEFAAGGSSTQVRRQGSSGLLLLPRRPDAVVLEC